ncbi:hypothetical protein GFS60_01761 [Rhodococcus sp. WAY2]|nr:hypothetical protein GFS60_01761 [Rhodococcus sp. WAY2]
MHTPRVGWVTLSHRSVTCDRVCYSPVRKHANTGYHNAKHTR